MNLLAKIRRRDTLLRRVRDLADLDAVEALVVEGHYPDSRKALAAAQGVTER